MIRLLPTLFWLNSSMQLLTAVLGNDSAILYQIMASLDQAIRNINQQFNLLMKPNLSLYDIFADSPEILKLLRSSNSTTDLVTALLKIPLINTTSLLMLQNETTASLCAKPLTFYKSTFQVTDDKTANELRNLLCSIGPDTWNKVTEELVRKIGAAELLAMLGYNFTSYTPSTNPNMTSFNAEIDQLIQNVMKLFSANASFQIPTIDEAAVNDVIRRVYLSVNASNVDQLVSAIMMSVAPLYGSGVWNTAMMYQSAIDVVIQYVHDILSLIQPGADGSVDFEVCVIYVELITSFFLFKQGQKALFYV